MLMASLSGSAQSVHQHRNLKWLPAEKVETGPRLLPGPEGVAGDVVRPARIYLAVSDGLARQARVAETHTSVSGSH